MRNQILMLESSSTADTLCDNFFSEPGAPRTRASIQNLVSLGARVSVVTFLSSDRDTQDPDDWNSSVSQVNAELAALGNGEAFAATEGPALLEAVERFVSEGVSCEISLEGKVQADGVCRGEVKLGDEVLACDATDGFRLKDESTLELTGSACDRLRTEAPAVSARFPCDVIVLL